MPNDAKELRPLGNNVRTLRQKRQLTQKQLAERANVTPWTISRLELSSDLGRTPLASLLVLAKALEVDLEELYKSTPIPDEEPT